MHLPDFQGLKLSSVPLSQFTTWHIGGPADWFVEPQSLRDLEILINSLRDQNISWFLLGNGSNILFSDSGFRGVIIHLGDGFHNIQFTDSIVIAGAGAQLNLLTKLAADKGFTGIEGLAGIPGTIGGAAFTNAGAYDQSFLSRCIEIQGLCEKKGFKTITDIRPGYRSGGFPDDFIITGLHLSLTPGDSDRIHQLMNQYLERRRSTQPLSKASAGCTFKNPDNSGAGRLIDELGFKGFKNGRAMISEKHANFVINSGGASASEIIKLIGHVRSKVSETCGVELELEVLIIDENGNRIDPEGTIR
ncbi:UDP-N-acetylmuramate dehydrogenase [bacterium]|nr:UDP-N-acetylmuramate dehydrogenase [bacterium]